MTQLVGILNVTPDSFSDGGLFIEPEAATRQAEKLFADGAALVDVGAESTRPGAKLLTTEEEWQRLEPVLQQQLKRYPEQISVDTYHPETAGRALALGAVIINDITGMDDPRMAKLAAKAQIRCIIGYMPAPDPQSAHSGKLIDDIGQVREGLLAKARALQKIGVHKDKIILDPCIGFGKTPELNRELLRFAREVPDYPVMIGYSRKRFLGEHRMELEPNLEAGRMAIESGAAYLRVHDVAGHSRLLY